MMLHQITARSAAAVLTLCFSIFTLSAKEYVYSVPDEPWDEANGNHRAVLAVESDAQAASLEFNWRRHDLNVADRRFVIVNAATGTEVTNILRKKVDSEVCDIVFGPVEKGTYYFYYLPYKVQTWGGACNTEYLPQEAAPDRTWSSSFGEPVKASVLKVESRTQFDSFYPMELKATAKECEDYVASNSASLYVFPEDRAFPARMLDAIPYRWLSKSQGEGFKGEALPNEYYAFQVCVWAPKYAVGNLKWSATPLTSGKKQIPAASVTCFNTEGTDAFGNPVTFDVSVDKGRLQPLWLGVDIPSDQPEGTYSGVLTIEDDYGCKARVPVSLKVSGKSLEDRGDSEIWKHSRLRWLNSTLGIEDRPTDQYVPVSEWKNTASCLGRTVAFDPASGSASQIDSWGTELLESPVRFVIVTGGKERSMKCTLNSTTTTEGTHLRSYSMEDEDFEITCDVRFEFDGWFDTKYSIRAKKDVKIDDIRLEIPMKEKVAQVFSGFGAQGMKTPREFRATWDGPTSIIGQDGMASVIPTGEDLKHPFDSFWIGSGYAGLHCELRGSSYSGPLLNVYHPEYPDSWNNSGKGGLLITRAKDVVKVTAFSGERTMAKDATVDYEYAFIVTPVKKLTTKDMFADRYLQGWMSYPNEEDYESGVNVVVIHHAHRENPCINYPYIVADTLKNWVSNMHSHGCKAKIYYTLRELSNVCTELWAIRSMGHEIVSPGEGGGYSWLQEHLVSDYTPMWYNPFDFEKVPGLHAADAAVMMAAGKSRWFNYYIEGLAWLIKETSIDGIYMDDVTFDRRTVKRMRRAFDSVKPGCLVNLHSNTDYSKSPALQYAEFFPYIDKVWFGEFFRYEKMSPENWLLESSGIPFGLYGDMLQDGGNRWLGMQYGMTDRLHWTERKEADPRIMWKVWDDFGIRESEMHGYWEVKPYVKASDEDVKVTAFVKEGSALLSVGNYSTEAKEVTLTIDWKRLELDPEKVVMTAPEIEYFQKASSWKPGDTISVPAKQGWVIILEEK